MINVRQLRDLIIKPTLELLHSDYVLASAEELLVFTCAAETFGGNYIKQVNGPALGIYQMEPETYNDIWQNFISGNSKLRLMLISNFDCHSMPDEQRLIYDLRFATAMSRIHYLRVKEKLPDSNDVEAMWKYYKRYYNTPAGASMKDATLKRYTLYANS